MAAVKPIEVVEEKVASRSPAQDAWREFRRNKVAVGGMVFIIILLLGALLAPFITPYNFAHQNNAYTRQKPMTGYIVTTDKLEACHWKDTPIEWGCTIFLAGSDSLGRDLWSRVAYGSRVSLAVAIVAASVALIIGIIYGTISGFSGGWVDNLMMRIVDFLYAVPVLPIIILMTVYFQALARAGVDSGVAGVLINLNQLTGGLMFVFIAVGALNWIGLARLARGQVLSYKQKEFVEAATAMGASDRRIIQQHLVPNIIGPLLIAESLAIPGYIFLEATLSFIGLGVNPPTPSWGAMINEGYQGLKSNPHLVLIPGIALALTTLAFNFMGDGLRDAFDPQLRGK
ncbi:MAG: ABC transporter permease [Anaerolineae bacterium]|nr:ABC transporter permease [Anaerolineae bacterium]MCO5187373.1 ABC transporter permease [Anaerolineae bacterium]MCO5194947.1 ABC transporter permease [Anaerolineae bacterium]MCO5196287.1 ABC transporter permease [Anaerolineae bacterium]MCO5204423.1 ABC transporter permease [Anaerolineae bacterium]